MKEKEIVCKTCGGIARYYDKVKRIVRTGYGKRYSIRVCRYICPRCGAIHRRLPSNLIPYKHYQKNIIEGFLSGELSSCDLAFEDYPCDATIQNWKRTAL